MKIQTLSILVGSSACNAHCPYCVSRMTPNQMPLKPQEPNRRRFTTAVELAHAAGATTAMLTGKGEPTLWPDLVTEYLLALTANKYFPLIELQTNGLRFADRMIDKYLLGWYHSGLTTIALSVAHWDQSENASIYGRSYDLGEMVSKLHDIGYSVRICCSLVAGLIDDWRSATTMITTAVEWKAEQLTFTPIAATRDVLSKDTEVLAYTKCHQLTPEQIASIRQHLDQFDLLIELSHGGRVYDVDGQNVCLNNCLTGEVVRDNTTMRNLIFHPDGSIRFDWEHEGSRIL